MKYNVIAAEHPDDRKVILLYKGCTLILAQDIVKALIRSANRKESRLPRGWRGTEGFACYNILPMEDGQ
jgi:hypothetical protein